MSEMHLKEPGFTYTACDPFTKNIERKLLETENTGLCKQEIQIIFTRMILIKLVFSMVWLEVNIKI